MLKSEAVAEVLRLAGTTPAVVTTGHACRMACAAADRPENFYMTGSMGLAAAVALGLATCAGTRVIALDGDGSLLMNVSVLCAVGSSAGARLTHVVLDDGCYASTGGQPTGSAACDIPALARAAGYRFATTVGDRAALGRALWRSFADAEGSSLIHCRLAAAAEDPGPRIGTDLRTHAADFRRAVSGQRNG